MTSEITSSVPDRSEAFSADRIKGICAPYFSATAAISSSSVETITSSKRSELIAVSIGHAITGLPEKDLMFFREMRLLPPLAGIMARIFILEIHLQCRSHTPVHYSSQRRQQAHSAEEH